MSEAKIYLKTSFLETEPLKITFCKFLFFTSLIKFQGVKLPGGIELNGRQIYDDAQRELDQLLEKMSNTYELPPLDLIG